MKALLDYIGFIDDPAHSWKRGFAVQLRVIGALIMRDAMARFGHDNIGFFWVIGEPLLLTCGVMGLWALSGQGHAAEIGVVPFALTGYSYITLWRHIVAKSMRVMTHSASLSFHNHVRFIDVLLARSILEIAAIAAAFTVAYVPLALLGFVPLVHDPLLLIGGYLLGGWFSMAFGFVLAGITELSEPVERFVQPAMYITLPATGVFFMVEWLPPYGQQVMAWSPLVNGIEMFRGGLFPATVTPHYDVFYLVKCCVALTAVGLFLCQYAQRHVQLQ